MVCALPVEISAIACAIAEKTEDDDDLALIVTTLSLLENALITILAQEKIF